MIAPSEEIAAQEKIDLEAQQSITELAPIRSAFFTINFAKVGELAALFAGGSGGEGEEGAEELEYGLPADDNHIHFGGGQTQTTIDLPTGTHTMQLVLGDMNHIPHSPPVASEVITIVVE